MACSTDDLRLPLSRSLSIAVHCAQLKESEAAEIGRTFGQRMLKNIRYSILVANVALFMRFSSSQCVAVAWQCKVGHANFGWCAQGCSRRIRFYLVIGLLWIGACGRRWACQGLGVLTFTHVSARCEPLALFVPIDEPLRLRACRELEGGLLPLQLVAETVLMIMRTRNEEGCVVLGMACVMMHTCTNCARQSVSSNHLADLYPTSSSEFPVRSLCSSLDGKRSRRLPSCWRRLLRVLGSGWAPTLFIRCTRSSPPSIK